MLSDFARIIAFWKVPRLHPFVLVGVTCRPWVSNLRPTKLHYATPGNIYKSCTYCKNYTVICEVRHHLMSFFYLRSANQHTTMREVLRNKRYGFSYRRTWVWGIDGMILTGEHLSILRKLCPSATLSKSLTWTDLESNPDFRSERSATNRLAMVRSWTVWCPKLYLKIEFLPHSEHSFWALKTNQLVLCRERNILKSIKNTEINSVGTR